MRCVVVNRLDTYQEGQTQDTYWLKLDHVSAVNIKQESTHDGKMSHTSYGVLLTSGMELGIDEESARKVIDLLERDARGPETARSRGPA
jgi:hypothetical protein